MAFILGIWMWDHYFSDPVEYEVGTEEVALLKIDRDLRLAEAMGKDPAWLKMFAGADEVGDVRRHALQVLAQLEKKRELSPRAVEARSVITAAVERSSTPIIVDLADDGQGSWWRAQLLYSGVGNGSWIAAYQASLKILRERALGCSSVMAALAVAGLFFIPHTLRKLVAGSRRTVHGYAGAWSPALGLTVFMVGTLAWIGYVGALDFGISAVRSLPPLMGIVLDTAARLLPSLLAVGFLFKRPGHAVRVLGLNRPPHFALIAGTFALLLVADRLLGLVNLQFDSTKPGGGLSLLDEGVFGLVFLTISACIVAPFAEEVLYRGVLFRSLGNKLGVLPAALISSVVFSAVHFYGLYGFVSVAIFGFSCALLYTATGSLVSVILLHALYNAMIKIPEWIFYHAKLPW